MLCRCHCKHILTVQLTINFLASSLLIMGYFKYTIYMISLSQTQLPLSLSLTIFSFHRLIWCFFLGSSPCSCHDLSLKKKLFKEYLMGRILLLHALNFSLELVLQHQAQFCRAVIFCFSMLTCRLVKKSEDNVW